MLPQAEGSALSLLTIKTHQGPLSPERDLQRLRGPESEYLGTTSPCRFLLACSEGRCRPRGLRSAQPRCEWSALDNQSMGQASTGTWVSAPASRGSSWSQGSGQELSFTSLDRLP